MALVAQQVALEVIRSLRPVVEKIRRHDRSLADQLRRAASSVALNIAEGERSTGGTQRARFESAAGSASESRVALEVAQAWGYVSAADAVQALDLLDRMLALLWGLTRRR